MIAACVKEGLEGAPQISTSGPSPSSNSLHTVAADATITNNETPLRIGAFSIHVFGKTKASKPEVIDVLGKINRVSGFFLFFLGIFPFWICYLIIFLLSHYASTSITIGLFILTFFTLLYVAYQTHLLRRQIFGEVYQEAKIRNLEFFLPQRRKCEVKYFTDKQKEKDEFRVGEEIKILKGEEIELFVRFWLDAPQTLRIISFGFLDGSGDTNYEGHPIVLENTKRFLKKEISPLPRAESIDWHGQYSIEYLNPRRMPKGHWMVISFFVKGDKEGKFPISFDICTDEAKRPYNKILWVNVDGACSYDTLGVSS